MKYAFISDIHSNLDALETVLEAIDGEDGIDKIFCVGDIVGYGAQPKECMAAVRDRHISAVAGNHDYGAVGLMDLSYFNPVAREAIEWTAGQLDDGEKEYIKGLPLQLNEEGFYVVHGTLGEPESFGYILSDIDALLMFRLLDKDFCFTGHSHYPCVFIEGEELVFSREPEVKAGPSEKFLVNVGSVGQPRDSDPRASFVIFDEEERKVTTRRLKYDIQAAAKKILDAGLPEVLADRLLIGA